MILTVFVALADTGRLDIPSIFVFIFFFAWIARRTVMGRGPLLSYRMAFLFSVGYIFFFVFDAIMLSRSFISAIIHMVLLLELAKLAQEKKDKDYLYLIILAFLQVLAASSLTIDMSFILMLLLFLVALVSTLMSFDIYRSQRQEPGARSTRIAGPLGGMSVWATMWIVIIGLGLFLVIPHIGTGYFSRPRPRHRCCRVSPKRSNLEDRTGKAELSARDESAAAGGNAFGRTQVARDRVGFLRRTQVVQDQSREATETLIRPRLLQDQAVRGRR